jgi:hypothetical protein
MLTNFATLRKVMPSLSETAPRSSQYTDLILQLFQSPTAVAVVRIGPGQGAIGVCEEIAGELAASGKRVVVVPVEGLLRMNPITVPGDRAVMSEIGLNVWLWPSPLGRSVEFFRGSQTKISGGENWLDALRRNFDSVLLDCPSVNSTFGVTEVAAMANAAVLLVEAGRTSRQQVQDDQRALQVRGATLTGCILLRQEQQRSR